MNPARALRAEGASLREALHAEWTKLRTVPSTGWLLLTVIVLTAGASALAAAVVKCPTSCGEDTTKLSLTGILLGQAALAAKAIILAGVVLAAGAMATAWSLIAGRYILPGNGFTGAHGTEALSLSAGPTLRAAAGSVLYLALIALFSLGLATALRDSGVSIAVMLGLLYIVPLLTDLGTLDPRWEHRLQEWGPMTAGLAIQATRNLKALPIGPWPGLGVLAVWAAAALLAGGLVLRLRDA
jgi:ABC-2 type transport system permease protein